MIFLRPISNKSYDIEKNLDITKPPYSEQIFPSPLALRNIEVPLSTAFFFVFQEPEPEKVLIDSTCNKCPCTMFFAQSERVQYYYLDKIGINEINYNLIFS